MWLMMAAIGCGDAGDTTDTTDTTDAPTTDAPTTPPTGTPPTGTPPTGTPPTGTPPTGTPPTGTPPTASCTPLTDGNWDADGGAFGMLMGVQIRMDEAACTFEFLNWDMMMGSVPDHGTIDGVNVTLGGDAYWDLCTGTVLSSDEAEGTCDDGKAWHLTLQ